MGIILLVVSSSVNYMHFTTGKSKLSNNDQFMTNKSSLFIFLLSFTGSENNSLYVYYKGLSKQLMTYKFDTVRSVLVRS